MPLHHASNFENMHPLEEEIFNRRLQALLQREAQLVEGRKEGCLAANYPCFVLLPPAAAMHLQLQCSITCSANCCRHVCVSILSGAQHNQSVIHISYHKVCYCCSLFVVLKCICVIYAFALSDCTSGVHQLRYHTPHLSHLL